MRAAYQGFPDRVDSMLVTEYIFFVLFAVGVLAMGLFVVGDVSLAVTYKVNIFLDRLSRKVPAEQYSQLVVLPLCGAIVGGFISTALVIFIDHPPWKPDFRTNIGWILIAIALVVIVAGPLWVHAQYANPKNLDIGQRIDRLKAGDWTRDSKADVMKTIEKQWAAITKRLNNKGILFWASLILVIVSAAGLLAFDYVNAEGSSGVIATFVIAAIILCGVAVAARYWMRPASLRSARKDLASFRAEADNLSLPALTAPPSHASAAPHRYDHRDLWIAAGGLLVGVILTGLGAVRSRGERQG
jgi:hypothetical protein